MKIANFFVYMIKVSSLRFSRKMKKTPSPIWKWKLGQYKHFWNFLSQCKMKKILRNFLVKLIPLGPLWTAVLPVSYLQQHPWTCKHIRVFVRHLFGNSLVIHLWNLGYFIVDRKAFAWWPQVIRIDFDANVHHLHLLIYLAVQTLPTWCFCPFLSILMHWDFKY